MQQVITAETAKKITGGRTPLVPVEYETACRALAECLTLDEAKYWDNAADAYAAWAKIRRDDKLIRDAKLLKLHAYKRMGEIAGEISPVVRGGGGTRGGSSGGPHKALREIGMPDSHARAARALAKMPLEKFEKLISAPRVPSPTVVERRAVNCSSGWAIWRDKSNIHSVRAFCRKTDAREFAALFAADERALAAQTAREVTEWLDEFEQHLRLGK